MPDHYRDPRDLVKPDKDVGRVRERNSLTRRQSRRDDDFDESLYDDKPDADRDDGRGQGGGYSTRSSSSSFDPYADDFYDYDYGYDDYDEEPVEEPEPEPEQPITEPFSYEQTPTQRFGPQTQPETPTEESASYSVQDEFGVSQERPPSVQQEFAPPAPKPPPEDKPKSLGMGTNLGDMGQDMAGEAEYEQPRQLDSLTNVETSAGVDRAGDAGVVPPAEETVTLNVQPQQRPAITPAGIRSEETARRLAELGLEPPPPPSGIGQSLSGALQRGATDAYRFISSPVNPNVPISQAVAPAALFLARGQPSFRHAVSSAADPPVIVTGGSGPAMVKPNLQGYSISGHPLMFTRTRTGQSVIADVFSDAPIIPPRGGSRYTPAVERWMGRGLPDIYGGGGGGRGGVGPTRTISPTEMYLLSRHPTQTTSTTSALNQSLSPGMTQTPSGLIVPTASAPGGQIASDFAASPAERASGLYVPEPVGEPTYEQQPTIDSAAQSGPTLDPTGSPSTQPGPTAAPFTEDYSGQPTIIGAPQPTTTRTPTVNPVTQPAVDPGPDPVYTGQPTIIGAPAPVPGPSRPRAPLEEPEQLPIPRPSTGPGVAPLVEPEQLPIPRTAPTPLNVPAPRPITVNPPTGQPATTPISVPAPTPITVTPPTGQPTALTVPPPTPITVNPPTGTPTTTPITVPPPTPIEVTPPAGTPEPTPITVPPPTPIEVTPPRGQPAQLAVPAPTPIVVGAPTGQPQQAPAPTPVPAPAPAPAPEPVPTTVNLPPPTDVVRARPVETLPPGTGPRPLPPVEDAPEPPRQAPRPPGTYPRAIEHNEQVEYRYDPESDSFTANRISATEPVVTNWDRTPPGRIERDVGGWRVVPNNDGVSVNEGGQVDVPEGIRQELQAEAARTGEPASTVRTHRFSHDLDTRGTQRSLSNAELIAAINARNQLSPRFSRAAQNINRQARNNRRQRNGNRSRDKLPSFRAPDTIAIIEEPPNMGRIG